MRVSDENAVNQIFVIGSAVSDDLEYRSWLTGIAMVVLVRLS